MITTETLSPQEVAARVLPYVADRQIGDIALQVDDARIHLRNGYWNIPIRPSRWPDPLFPTMRRWPRSKTRYRRARA